MRFVMLCMTLSVSKSNIIDSGVTNPACPSNTWSSFGNGKRCRDNYFSDNSGRRFVYYANTNACLLWHSGTRTWQGAKNSCISLNSELAIPTTSNERADWGWRGINYWANAKRPDSQSLTSVYWDEYVSGRGVASGNVVWDSGQPSGRHCWFRPFQSDGCEFEYCIQVRKNNQWNDEFCDDGNSYYCYTPASCTACSTGACSAWHGRTQCTSNSDSVCHACTGECSSGYTPTVGGGCTCVACATGTFKSSSGAGTCTACSTGSCGAGQRRVECTTHNDFSCQACGVQCSAGHTMDVNQVCTCQQCPAGSYKPSSGNQPCEPCEFGKYQSSVGAPNCIQCQASAYSETTYGMTSACATCPVGTSSMTTYIDGWLEQHYSFAGNMMGGVNYMGFDALTPLLSRKVSVIYYGQTSSWPWQQAPGQWGSRWRGIIRIVTQGEYEFSTLADDASLLWVNGILVVTGVVHQYRYGKITLPVGDHHVRAHFAEYGGGAAMHVWYSGPQVSGTVALPGFTTKSTCFRCPFDSVINKQSITSVSECACGPGYENTNALPNFLATVTCTGASSCGCINDPITSSGSISDSASSIRSMTTCTWRIVSDYEIYLYFTNFELINYGSYVYQAMTINTSGDIITLTPSMNLDKMYRSPGGDLTVTIVSSFKLHNSGFTTVWGLTPCNRCSAGKYSRTSMNADMTCSGGCGCVSTLNSNTGVIRSSITGNYLNNRNCVWMINSTVGVEIKFTSFWLESIRDTVIIDQCTSALCPTPEQLDLLTGRLYDADLPKVYKTTTGFLRITFTSDVSMVNPGFEAVWAVKSSDFLCEACPENTFQPNIGSDICKDCLASSYQPNIGSVQCICSPAHRLRYLTADVTCSGGCGCVSTLNSSTGVIRSSITGNYQDNRNCIWMISSTADVEIQFTSFVTEEDFDKVVIARCTSALCPIPEQLGLLTGSLSPADLTRVYNTTTGFLRITFISDHSVVRLGFQAVWTVKSGESLCEPCPACGSGKIIDPVTTTCSCMECAQGTYKTGSGNEACSTCTTPTCGVWQSLSTCIITADAVCQACSGTCNTGQTPNPDAVQCNCMNCVAGSTYKSSTGTGACAACSTTSCGIWQGLSTCTITADAVCQACAGICGSGQTADTAGGCTCVSCGAGTYKSATGTVACTLCEAGKYQSNTGSLECTVCESGKYLNTTGGVSEVDCALCAVGSFQPYNGTSQCQACPANSENNATGSTYCMCSVGYTRGGVSMDSPCQLCPPGKVKTVVGNETCSDCPAASTDANAVMCQPNGTVAPIIIVLVAVSAIPNVACALLCGCRPGYSGPTASCSPCAAGAYKEVIGSEVCVECASGKYSAATGSNTEADCTACPANSGNNPPGSLTEQTCVCSAGSSGVNGQPPCTQCVSGTYQPYTEQTRCEDCPVNSGHNPPGSTAETSCLCNAGYTFADGGGCIVCVEGAFKPAAGNVACSLCPANSLSPAASTSNTACKCNAGYSGDDGADCTVCAPGTYSAQAGSRQCPQCPMGTYQPGTGMSECVDCAPGKFLDVPGRDAESECQSCPAHAGNSPAGSAYESACKCDAGSAGPAGGPVCALCDPGKHQASTGAVACVECDAGTYLSSPGSASELDCLACPAGLVSEAAAGTCRQCDAHSQRVPGLPAVPDECKCSVGYWREGVSWASSCQLCPSGKVKTVVGDQACDDCPAESTSPDAFICQPDNSDVSTDPPSNGGLTLPAITVLVGVGTVANVVCVVFCGCGAGYTGIIGLCIACSGGNFKEGIGPGTCSACPSHSSSPRASGESTDCRCNKGYTGGNGETCTACEAGTFKTTEGDSGCTNCAAGTFMADAGSASGCVMCRKGTYQNLPASISCALCASGTYLGFVGSDTETDCQSCAAGKFLQATGSTSASDCEACPLGKYQDLVASAACVNCPSGKYLGSTGSTTDTACQVCPVYSGNNAAGSTNQATCVCSAGAAGLGGGPTCELCAVGKFQAATAAALCDDCASGKYLGSTGNVIDTACLPCPGNTGNVAGSAALSTCTCYPGYTGPDGQTCSQCSPGTYKAVSGSATCSSCPEKSGNNAAGSEEEAACKCNAGSQGFNGGPHCHLCDKGTYQPSIGAGLCEDCASGKYLALTGSTAETACEACPANSGNNPFDHSSVESCVCDVGHTGSDGTACDKCVSGTFKSSPGSLACESCPDASHITPEGACSRNECVCGQGHVTVSATVCDACPRGMWRGPP